MIYCTDGQPCQLTGCTEAYRICAKNIRAVKAARRALEPDPRILDLEAQLAGALKDAERYRWLRKQKVTFLFDLANGIVLSKKNLQPRSDIPDQFNNAIDAAIAQEGK